VQPAVELTISWLYISPTMPEKRYDTVILVGDVGGTNTTLAIVGRKKERFSIIEKRAFSSQELTSFDEAVDEAMRDFQDAHPDLSPERCCISAAGPVEDNTCRLSNLSWQIDGGSLAGQTGIPTAVINDFSAVCYGIPVLASQKPDQLSPVPHSGGGNPVRKGAVTAVVGAGTGLGMGYLIRERNRYTAFPSEGGHSDFADFDPETSDIKAFLYRKLGRAPDAEQLVSGQGIANIFDYHTRNIRRPSETVQNIQKLPPAARPSHIAKASLRDDVCGQTMRSFVRMYGKFASNVALQFLPSAGLFLAGGIVGKNESWFLQDGSFMEAFEDNFKESVRPVLKRIPVYIIRDYTISLYGAAHAAVSIDFETEVPRKGEQ